MTPYRILKTATLAGTGGTEDGYEDVGFVEARSAQSAIRELLAKNGHLEGEYVAIPERSFRPVQVSVETKTALRFS